jgi:hypothetical protein
METSWQDDNLGLGCRKIHGREGQRYKTGQWKLRIFTFLVISSAEKKEAHFLSVEICHTECHLGC